MSKLYKSKVPTNVNATYISRFYNHLWTYRVCQLTTGNIQAMKASAISESGNNLPVFSDIQPHGMYRFSGDRDESVVVAVPRSSTHHKNLLECAKVSIMAGHTNPQIYHWFKLLGVVPTRSLISGDTEVLQGFQHTDVWNDMFVRHPVIHDMAQKMWETDESKTDVEKKEVLRREKEEDEKRMFSMSDKNWRKKHDARERNPTTDEDVEKPLFVMKPDAFTVFRVKRDVQLYGDYSGKLHRVWDETFQPIDPLARVAPRFLRVINMARQKLVASLNINYNLKLTNVFVFSIDSRGLWAMGCQENFAEDERKEAKEQWSEFRFEFGKDQVIETDAELEFWIRGLMRLGVPETGQNSGHVDNMDPQDTQFRA
jgi:hypothetical protein